MRVLSTLELDPNDGHYWNAIDEEIADQLNKLDAATEGGIPYELRDQIKREAFLVELDADEVHIGFDPHRFVNMVS